ncbi:hypothetical protein GE061_012193, partial [Apolygus lucorum]
SEVNFLRRGEGEGTNHSIRHIKLSHFDREKLQQGTKLSGVHKTRYVQPDSSSGTGLVALLSVVPCLSPCPRLNAAQIQLARLFDPQLVEIRRKVCEPSLLGAGTKARVAIATFKSEAECLLESVTKLSESVVRDNAARVDNLTTIEDWIEKISSEIEPLEAKGKEAGMILTNGTKESEVNETENGIDRSVSNCDSVDNRYHPGRKSSISRRLFETVMLTPSFGN